MATMATPRCSAPSRLSYTPEQATRRFQPHAYVPDLLRLPVAVRPWAQVFQSWRGVLDYRRLAAQRQFEPLQRRAVHHRHQRPINAGGQGATANQVNPSSRSWAASARPTRISTAPRSPIRQTACSAPLAGTFCVAPASSTWTRTSPASSPSRRNITFQLRGEAFNITNTPTFSNPNATCCWVTNATTGAVNYNNFAVITGTASTQRHFAGGRIPTVLS